MTIHQRLFAGALFAFAPLSLASAQNAGKTLAMDFRTSISIEGAPDTTVVLGHAFGSADKMRLDVSGAAAKVSPIATDSISMIVTDSGRTITYLDAKKSQYMRVRPSEIVSQAQAMSGMKMEFSGTEAKVDNLGAGPTILGHPTTHYRVATGMTMVVSAKGVEQSVKIASTTDTYYANDIASTLNPFASLSGSDMANMFGSGNADFAQKLKAAQAKLPKRTPLRAESSAKITAQGQTRITNTAAEVTALKWVNSDPKAFEVPTGYTQAGVYGLGSASISANPQK